VEAHPGQQRVRRLAEVRGTQLAPLRVVPQQLLRRVAQLEARVVVAAVLEVHDPQPVAAVEVVLGEQVVVARDRGERVRGEGGLQARQHRKTRAEALGDGDRAPVHDAHVPLGQAEHVEVEQER